MNIKVGENAFFLMFLVVYVFFGLILSRYYVDVPFYANEVLGFYSKLGFDIDFTIARLIVVYLLVSVFCHVAMISLRRNNEKEFAIKNCNSSELLYLLIRAIGALVFCAVVIGALGDVVSSRRTSIFSKEISVAIGGFVLGGVTWLVRDFIVSALNKFTRN